MEHQLVIEVEVDVTREVERASDILCIGNVEERVLPFGIYMEMHGARCPVEQVARCFHIGLDSPAAIVIRVAHAELHDEEVLVVVAQNRVARRAVVQILVLEGFANPRHVDIVQVQQVYRIAVLASLVIPFILPSHREHTAVELRTVLQVVVNCQLRSSIDATTETAGEEGCDKSREAQARTNTVFNKVTTTIVFQSSDGFIGTTQVYGEGLRTMEQITVLEGNGECSTKVARSIGTLWLDRDGRRLVHTQVDVTVKHRLVFVLNEVDTGIAHDAQTTKVVVGVTQVTGRINLPLRKEGVTLQDFLTQGNIRLVGVTAEEVDMTYRVDLVWTS